MRPSGDEGDALPAGEAGAYRLVHATLRDLLRIEDRDEAVALLVGLVERLGGAVGSRSGIDESMVPVDLSLGTGAPLYALAEPLSLARLYLDQFLPALVDDATTIVELLERAGRERSDTLDPVTGLLSRGAITAALQLLQPGDAVALVALDGLEDAGDDPDTAHRALVTQRAFTRLLRGQAREGDSFGVAGDHEFILVLPRAGVDGAVAMLLRLRKLWAEARPHPVTFSAGVAHVDADGGAIAAHRADRALYAARAAGRDRIITTADSEGAGA